jgi:hypothetical protein
LEKVVISVFAEEVAMVVIRRFVTAFAILIMAGFCAPAADAAVYYVAKTGNDGNDGSSGTPWLTINHALSSAAASDEIRVGAGTYTEDVLVPYSPLTNLVLRGGYNPADWTWAPGSYTSVMQAATATNDVLKIRSAGVSVIAFTIRGGRYGVWGAHGNLNSTYSVLDSHKFSRHSERCQRSASRFISSMFRIVIFSTSSSNRL